MPTPFIQIRERPRQPTGCPDSFRTSGPGTRRSVRDRPAASATILDTMNQVPSSGLGRPSTSPKNCLVMVTPSISVIFCSLCEQRATLPDVGMSITWCPSASKMFTTCGVRLTNIVIPPWITTTSRNVENVKWNCP